MEMPECCEVNSTKKGGKQALIQVKYGAGTNTGEVLSRH